MALEASGQILVVDLDAGTNTRGALFRVNPTTGARTVLSDFGSGSNQGVDPASVAVEASGQILVDDINAGTNSLGALFRANPTTGARTLLSDFGNSNQGPLGSGFLGGVTVEPSGQILVVDLDAGTNTRGGLFRVNPTTGARAVLSDFGDSNQGPLGLEPAGLPEPSIMVLLCSGVCLLGLLRRCSHFLPLARVLRPPPGRVARLSRQSHAATCASHWRASR